MNKALLNGVHRRLWMCAEGPVRTVSRHFAAQRDSKMRNLSILKQVLSIVGLAVLGFLIIGGVYFWSDVQVSSERQAANAAAQRTAVVQEVQYLFLNARRREKDFLLRRDEKYIDQLNGIVQEIRGNLSTLREMGVPAAVGAQVTTVSDGIATYHDQFKQVAADVIAIGLTEELGLRGKLRSAVHNVEKRLNEFGTAEMLVKMLMMRRHEKDFLLRIDPKYIGRIDDRRTELKALLDASDMDATARGEIEELIAVYVASFKDLADLILDLDEKTGALSDIFAEIEPIMQSVADEIAASGAVAIARADDVTAQTKTIIPASIAIVTLLAALAGFWVARTINNPIVAMTETMGELASGKRDVDVPATDYGNEIGRMAQSVTSFRDSLIQADGLAEQQRKAQQVEVERGERLMQRTSAFDTAIQEILAEVDAAVAQMDSTAGQMDKASSDLQMQATTVASSSSESAMNVQTVASATEELSASIVEIGSQIQNAAGITRSAVEQAESSVETVNSLETAVGQISEVVDLIKDIAEQTNLLALNATIEAARAGDAGKGFAVVANEVKSLSAETARATEQIERQITAVQSATGTTVSSISAFSKTINEVNQISAAVAAAIEEQTAATNEISRNVEEASVAVEDVSKNIQYVSDSAAVTKTAAGDVRGASDSIGGQAAQLTESIAKFLKDVRAI